MTKDQELALVYLFVIILAQFEHLGWDVEICPSIRAERKDK